MRRITIPARSIDLLRARAAAQPTSPYLCSVCKHQATFSTSSIRAVRTNGKIPFTEKIRQRIWGTDTPPGLEDPYGDKSVFDKTKERAKEEEAEEREVQKKAAQPDLSTYEPASTWDGLEKVGGFGGWWKENWDPEHQFQGFLPAEVVKDSDEVTAALHRAVVEVFVLQQAGMPLQDISAAAPGDDLTQEVQISPSATGATLQFSQEASLETIMQSLAPVINHKTGVEEAPTESEEDIAADRSTVDPLNPGSPIPAAAEETSNKGSPTESQEDLAADRSTVDPLSGTTTQMTYEELVGSWDPSWLQVSLENSEVKFAVIKRTMQLTGLRIPDSAIKPAKTVQALLTHLVKPPKPRKLVEALSQKEELLNLPNVSIYAKRITPVDKHESVGRWKVIEQELIDRGLPVTGRRGAPA